MTINLLTISLLRANNKVSDQSEAAPENPTEIPIASSVVDDASSLDEFSDDDYDTDEEGNAIGLFSKTSAAPHAQENTPASTLSKTDFLDGVKLPLQRPLLETLVSDFLQARFGPAPGIRSLAGSEQTNTSADISSSSGSGPSDGRGNSGSRKRSRGDDQHFDRGPGKGQDGNGDDPNKKRKGNSSTTSTQFWKLRKYACPYHQRDPSLVAARSCFGPGWPEVRRVKYDHLASS
jgi:hypothetical protein